MIGIRQIETLESLGFEVSDSKKEARKGFITIARRKRAFTVFRKVETGPHRYSLVPEAAGVSLEEALYVAGWVDGVYRKPADRKETPHSE